VYGVALTREERTRRLIAGRDAARAAGRRVGGPAPYGFRWSAGALVPVEHEQHVRWLIGHLAGRRVPLMRIVALLGELGLPARGAHWTQSTVARIARDERPDVLPETG
jgi:DNA invertase Pin-like site-specific DNA recombinase